MPFYPCSCRTRGRLPNQKPLAEPEAAFLRLSVEEKRENDLSADLRNVVVLGATGSIGRNTLEVIRVDPRLRVIGISAHTQLEMAARQCHEHDIPFLIATDQNAVDHMDPGRLPARTQLLCGQSEVERFVARDDVEIVVSAIVGSAGLRGSWAAIEAGKQVALANKETLVVAGQLVMPLAKRTGAQLIPVDSEHSAIFQSLQAGRRQDLERIILTASGGPFRELPLAELRNVTLQQALQHPTWNMGTKITIDSATMLNKALEIIEARWLFDLTADEIEVVIHPQSVVHSMVEFRDGSVIAQMSPPDMKLPIQFALTYPERTCGVADRFDWTQSQALTFAAPDAERFPALQLGHQVAQQGGTCGAVLNAAKEKAVQLFIDGELAFHEIVEVCREVLNNHTFDPSPTLEQLMAADEWARLEVDRWTMAS